jgi:hypothetical protein
MARDRFDPSRPAARRPPRKIRTENVMRKIILSLAVFGLTAGLTATASMAQSTFADVDADASGELSYPELLVAWPDLTQDEFSTADADLSTGLSTTELAALQPPSNPAATAVPPPSPGEQAPTSSFRSNSSVDSNNSLDEVLPSTELLGNGQAD